MCCILYKIAHRDGHALCHLHQLVGEIGHFFFGQDALRHALCPLLFLGKLFVVAAQCSEWGKDFCTILKCHARMLAQGFFALRALHIIDGGCHAGFGSYGAQKGDGAPVISAEEQQRQTADALAAWINLKS